MVRRISALFLGVFLSVPLQAAIQYEFRQVTHTDVEALSVPDFKARAVIDGDRSRLDFIEGSLYRDPSYVIMKDGARRKIVVNQLKKTYTETDLADLATAVGGSNIKVENLKTDVQKLGDHPVIAGVPTDHFRIQTSYDMTLTFGTMEMKQNVSTVIDKWTTSAFGDVGTSYLTGGAPRTGNPDLDKIVEAETSKVKGFPMRQVVTISTGSSKASSNSQLKINPQRKQVTEMIVTSVKEMPSNEGLFEIPAGYTKYAPGSETREEPGVHMISMEPAPATPQN